MGRRLQKETDDLKHTCIVKADLLNSRTRNYMTNAEIGAVFQDIAVRLKSKKENIFKVRAYEKAAGFITDWPVSIEEMAKDGRLREVSGIGEAIEKKITELVETGRLEYYERLKAAG